MTRVTPKKDNETPSNLTHVTAAQLPDSSSHHALSDLLRKRRDAGDTTLAAGVDAGLLRSDVARLIEHGLDLIEVRVDHFSEQELTELEVLLCEVTTVPTIATVRSAEEGGRWAWSDDQRIALLLKIAPYVSAVDIELKSTVVIDRVRPRLKELGTELLISFHDFVNTPSIDELRKIVDAALENGADLVKIATYINSPHDTKVLAELLATSNCDSLIVIGMGPLGTSTRVSFPSLGSLLTFSSVDGLSTAPGQVPLPTMLDTLRVLLPKFNERKIIDLKLMEYC
jgi:3-dehydroquinate dehydratase I